MTTRSLADIEKELLAQLSEKIKAEAKAIHDKEKATEHIRKFVEDNGGVKATIALIQAAYGKVKVSKKSGGTRTRHTMTEEDEAKIAKLFKEGKKSGEIAEIIGVSTQTINLRKKALGLTKARGKKK